MTTFSVIIPTYNRLNYLTECLASVAAQRIAPHEVIVVDDGSTDGTAEAVQALAGVTLIRQRNAGPGAARNRGAAAATGDYLAFLDSDDLWFPWSLEVMAALVEQHRPSLLSAQLIDFPDKEELEVEPAPIEGSVYADFLQAAIDGCWVGGGMMVVERTCFMESGGFTEDRLHAEDHDLSLRLGTLPGFVQINSPVTLARRLHLSNEINDLDKILKGLSRVVRVERNGGYPGGDHRQRLRQTVIARHVRSAVVGGIQAGHLRQALELYWTTFAWNLRAGRAAYLLGAPAMLFGRAILDRLPNWSQR